MSYVLSFFIGYEMFMLGLYMWVVYGLNFILEVKIDVKGGSICIFVYKVVKVNYIRSIGR